MLVPRPPIANDMAEGESIRVLPTLNEPVMESSTYFKLLKMSKPLAKKFVPCMTRKSPNRRDDCPTTGQEDIFGFAMRIADQWKLGSAKRDNSLLIAIAVNDRRMQILTGYAFGRSHS